MHILYNDDDLELSRLLKVFGIPLIYPPVVRDVNFFLFSVPIMIKLSWPMVYMIIALNGPQEARQSSL